MHRTVDSPRRSGSRAAGTGGARPIRVELTVAAALFRRGRLLLLRRADSCSAFPGLWDLPGGHVEVGERLLEALRREIREETGLPLATARPFFAGTYDYPRSDGSIVPTAEVDFLCLTRSSAEPVLKADEHSDYAWIGRYEPRRHPAPPLLGEIIRCALSRERAGPGPSRAQGSYGRRPRAGK